MNEEQKSFPVRYMVVEEISVFTNTYGIIDTSLEGGGSRVTGGCSDAYTAHHICKLLNESEGYVYPWSR